MTQLSSSSFRKFGDLKVRKSDLPSMNSLCSFRVQRPVDLPNSPAFVLRYELYGLRSIDELPPTETDIAFDGYYRGTVNVPTAAVDVVGMGVGVVSTS